MYIYIYIYYVAGGAEGLDDPEARHLPVVFAIFPAGGNGVTFCFASLLPRSSLLLSLSLSLMHLLSACSLFRLSIPFSSCSLTIDMSNALAATQRREADLAKKTEAEDARQADAGSLVSAKA